MAAEHELVDEFGGTWTDADARSIIGFDLLDAAAVLRDRGGVDSSRPRSSSACSTASSPGSASGPVAARRPPPARRAQRQGVPCALVTMSWRRWSTPSSRRSRRSVRGVVTGDDGDQRQAPPGAVPAGRHGARRRPGAVRRHRGLPDRRRVGGRRLRRRRRAQPRRHRPAPGRYIVRRCKTSTSTTSARWSPRTPPPPRAGERPADAGPEGDDGGGPHRRAAAALAASSTSAIVVFGGDGGRRGGTATPASRSVHAWAPYWTLDEGLAHLQARADTLHQVSPFWFQATGVDTIEVDPNTPTDATEEFLDRRRRERAGVPSILDAHRAGVMAAILADPASGRHVDAIVPSPPTATTTASTSTTSSSPSPTAGTRGRRRGRTGWPSSASWPSGCTPTAHADGQHPAGLRRRPDRRQRLLGLRLRGDHAARRRDPGDGLRLLERQHGPGPIAPLDWVDRVIAGTTAASGDPSKLVLGMPLYGYNWPIATTGTCPDRGRHHRDEPRRGRPGAASAARAGVRPGDGEWSFQYDLDVDDGTTSCTQPRQVNYVDADGAQQRMQRAVDAGFGGVALFALGYDRPRGVERRRSTPSPPPTDRPPATRRLEPIDGRAPGHGCP